MYTQHAGCACCLTGDEYMCTYSLCGFVCQCISFPLICSLIFYLFSNLSQLYVGLSVIFEILLSNTALIWHGLPFLHVSWMLRI